MRECLQDYIATDEWLHLRRWRRWSYKKFALHKIRQKIRLNRER